MPLARLAGWPQPAAARERGQRQRGERSKRKEGGGRGRAAPRRRVPPCGKRRRSGRAPAAKSYLAAHAVEAALEQALLLQVHRQRVSHPPPCCVRACVRLCVRACVRACQRQAALP